MSSYNLSEAAELRHELANAQASVEMAMARIGELESQVQRQLAAVQELYRNSGVVKTAELLARVEALEAENARLREALKPFVAIANLNGFPRGVDVTLWRRSTNEPGVEDITIKLSDCKKAYEALNVNP